jgi:MerR family copper efflux transcriptional regulator
MLNIGQAAQATGVSAKMIRHYEDIGLLPAARRTAAGYRQYDDGDVRTLRFIRHARDLGFPLPRIGRLLSLWSDRQRTSREVKELAEQHIRELDEKAQELLAMKAALEQLARVCGGDSRPDCPIIDSLASAHVGKVEQPGLRRAGVPTVSMREA